MLGKFNGHNANANRSASPHRVALLTAASIAALLALTSGPALATCDDSWGGGTGNWYGSNGWSGGDPNSGSTNVCITIANSTVDLTSTASIADLTLGATDTLNISGTLNVFGSSVANSGLIDLENGNLTVSGSSFTLTGGGTVQMQADAFLNQSSGGQTLFNFDNMIEGTGQLGQNGLSLNNESAGTVNANVSGGTLYLNGNGAVTNAGLLEATNGGFLQIDNSVANTGGNITANNGTVYLNAGITGGTLNTSGTGLIQNDGNTTLSGVTVSAGSTYTAAGQNYLEGTITNNGTITSPNGNLTILGGNVTLTGGGTVVMQSDTFINEGSGGLNLDNLNNLIEGSGQLGQNGMTLDNESGGTVDANVNGGTLYLNGGGAVTNAGLLEATNGGFLQIDNTINNTGANITASGGIVYINATINGGTLNATGTNLMENDGNTTLNGVTLSTGSTYTAAGRY